MAVDFIQKSAGNSASTTLSSGVTNTDTSFPLTSDTNFLAGGGIVIVDEGEATEELAYYTGKSGGALTVPLANRGLEGGSAQAHASGATVKGVLSADTWNNAMEALLNVVSVTDGAVDTTKVVNLTTAQALTNKTITDSTNNVMAKSLKSATTTVDVSAATAPTSGQVLTATASTTATWQTPASSGQATLIVPNTYVGEVGNVTTSGTTELTAITKTITNPAVAGQIFMTGSISVNTPTVANDFFIYKFYFAGAVLNTFTKTEPSTGGGGRAVITFSAAAAVANSGTQIMKITVARDTGTGTINVEGGRCYLSWIIAPGASTTA